MRAPRLRLRGRLVAAFLLVVSVSLGLSIIASLFTYSNRIRDELTPRIEQNRTVLDNTVQEAIDRADSFSYSYRSDPIFVDFLEGRLPRNQFLDQFAILLGQSNLDILELIDKNGKLVVDRELRLDRAGTDRSQISYFTDALDGRKVRTLGRYDERPSVLVSFPIRNSSGQQLGAMAVGYFIDAKFLERLSTSLGSELTLFRDGELAVTTLTDLRGDSRSLPPNIKTVLEEYAKSALENVQSSFPYEALQRRETLAGTSYLSLYVPLLGYEGEIIGTIRTSLSLAPVNAANQRAIVLLLIFNLITLGLAYLLALVLSRRIAEPVKVMEEGARHIGGGQLGAHVNVKTGDELEDLGVSLNTMSDQLHRLVTSLAISHQRNERVLQSIADGVFAVNRGGQIVLFNPAAERITGWRRDDVLGRPADDLLRFRSGKRPLSLSDYLPELGTSSESSFFRDVVLTTKAGEKHVTLTVAPLPAAGDQDIAGIATFYDMTKQYELDALRQDFSFLVAHELKTPLAALRGYLYLLERSLPNSNEKQEAYLSRLNSAAKQLAGLIESVLDMARIEQQTFAIAPQLQPLEPIIRELLDDLSFIAEPQRVRLIYRSPEIPLPLLSIDGVRIREVVGNFLTNAIKYSKPGESVEVVTELRDDAVVTSVIDRGPGIPPEEILRLFDKYYRTDPENKRVRGTGIGLFLSKHIIESHGGRVGVESEVGKGSRFYFTLPVPRAESADAPKTVSIPIRH